MLKKKISFKKLLKLNGYSLSPKFEEWYKALKQDGHIYHIKQNNCRKNGKTTFSMLYALVEASKGNSVTIVVNDPLTYVNKLRTVKGIKNIEVISANIRVYSIRINKNGFISVVKFSREQGRGFVPGTVYINDFTDKGKEHFNMFTKQGDGIYDLIKMQTM